MGDVLRRVQIRVCTRVFLLAALQLTNLGFRDSGATWDNTGMCTAPKLGYTVDDAVLQLTYAHAA